MSMEFCIYEVYMSSNVVSNELIHQAIAISGINNKSEVINEAMKFFIAFYSQKKLNQLRGKVKWEGNIDELREGRNAIN